MVKIITDYGYCAGVSSAIAKLEEAKDSFSALYLTHPLLHNIPENNSLMKTNHASFITEETKLKRTDALVLSAHGHTIEEENHYRDRCYIIDATCSLILARYKQVPPFNDKTTYLYLGKANHQETKAFLSHFPYFTLIDSTKDLIQQLSLISFESETVFIPQTTVSKESWSIVKEQIEKKSKLRFYLSICPLYERRFSQAIEALANVELQNSYFIVCGDHASSNANEIFEAVMHKYPTLNGCIALTIDQIDKNKIKGKDIYIASATSVSKTTVESLAACLKS